MLRTGFFAAALASLGGVTRAVFDSALELTDASDGEQSQAITIPANAELVVVMFASRAASASMGTHTVTLGGASPDYTPLPWTQNTNRNGVAIYGFLTANTGVGSQTWVSLFSGNSGIGSQVEFFFFSAGKYNPDSPFIGTGLQEVSSSGDPITVTYDPKSVSPLILTQCSQSQSSGSLSGYTGTNLTVQDFFDDSNTFYAVGYNNTLDDPGSTGFTLDGTGIASSYASMSLVEMAPVGFVWPDVLATEFIANYISTPGGDYTTTVSLGAEPSPGQRRYILAMAWHSANSAGGGWTDVTLGGKLMWKLHEQIDTAGNDACMGAFLQEMPTGTSASITLNVAGSSSRTGVMIYSIITGPGGLKLASANGKSGGGGNVADTTGLAVAAGGAIIAAQHALDGGPFTTTGDLIDDYEADVESNDWTIAGHLDYANAATGQAFRYNTTSDPGAAEAMAYAILEPIEPSNGELTGTYQGFTGSTAGGTSRNYTLDIGTAAADRVVVIGVGNDTGNPTGCTINGVTATMIAQASTSTDSATLFAAVVPSGSGNQTVTITYAASFKRSNVSCFVISGGASVTPDDIVQAALSSSSSGNQQLVADAADGVMIAIASSGGGVTWTWTGITEQFDSNAYVIGVSGAMSNSPGYGANTISAVQTTSTLLALAAAVWTKP